MPTVALSRVTIGRQPLEVGSGCDPDVVARRKDERHGGLGRVKTLERQKRVEQCSLREPMSSRAWQGASEFAAAVEHDSPP
jgi:hypothetical protein